MNVVDADLWPQLVKCLGEAQGSPRNLCIANRNVVASQGRWMGGFNFKGVNVRSLFELFPCEGVWSFLIGKPMLEALRAQHDYNTEALKVNGLILTIDAKMC